MELRHLRYFEAVARHSHVTRAAAELHIAQPALSKQISQLEQELGLPLFDRVGRNVRLTEAGEALLPHARAVMSQVEAARAEIAERIGLRKGRVSIGAPPTVGSQLLPRLLAKFNQHYSGIELRLHEAGVQTLLELLETGLTDVAVVTLPVEDSHLTVAPLFNEEMIVVVWSSHPFAQQETVRFSDLADQPWVLSPNNYELREATLHACEQAGFKPRVVLAGGETETLLRFVAAGLGIALVPRLAVQGQHDLVPLRVVDQNLCRALGLVWRGDRVASPAARALREFVVREFCHAT
ncbi:LysR family transcriptional regulator [Candidatus Viridilinea mediisalina]|uniref:LysR family transcriptional regulator n=1 Tax=Candidatus Viridilinea mediisalina TaxID=2024553 RepID=A0A2A6RG26_9CHLR|nr:LysR family transcriptional regulator [Candidatus Viridilinea mediisalina]PDW01881.1 LysR family transcriptional regulator [Candidatus Viridilinea mediisalina]